MTVYPRENPFHVLIRAAPGEVPADAAPARRSTAYIGVYENRYYGPLTVTAQGDGLMMSLGPAASPNLFAVKHVDRDRFAFQTIGENGYGLSNAAFEIGPAGTALNVVLDFYNTNRLGTFARR